MFSTKRASGPSSFLRLVSHRTLREFDDGETDERSC